MDNDRIVPFLHNPSVISLDNHLQESMIINKACSIDNDGIVPFLHNPSLIRLDNHPKAIKLMTNLYEKDKLIKKHFILEKLSMKRN